MDLKRLNELLEYSPHTGEVRLKPSKHKIIADADGFYTIYDVATKRRTKIKADRLCWALGNNKRLLKTQKILHKNLKYTDNRLSNLVLVSAKVFSKVQEAAKNLSGGLRLTPHHLDRYNINILYFSEKRLIKEIFCDIISARQRLLELQLKYAKVLTRHCCFD